MQNPIEEITDELYSLAWQDGKEGLNRRHELNIRFIKEIEQKLVENGKASNKHRRVLDLKEFVGTLESQCHDLENGKIDADNEFATKPENYRWNRALDQAIKKLEALKADYQSEIDEKEN